MHTCIHAYMFTYGETQWLRSIVTILSFCKRKSAVSACYVYSILYVYIHTQTHYICVYHTHINTHTCVSYTHKHTHTHTHLLLVHFNSLLLHGIHRISNNIASLPLNASIIQAPIRVQLFCVFACV